MGTLYIKTTILQRELLLKCCILSTALHCFISQKFSTLTVCFYANNYFEKLQILSGALKCTPDNNNQQATTITRQQKLSTDNIDHLILNYFPELWSVRVFFFSIFFSVCLSAGYDFFCVVNILFYIMIFCLGLINI